MWSVESVVSLIMACGSLLSVVYLAGVKITRLEVKVNTLWTFLMRRALLEGSNKGHLIWESPARVNLDPKIILYFGSMVDELRAFYKTIRHGKLSDLDLCMLIEQQWGARIIKKVCAPLGLQEGSCLLIALAVAREAEDCTVTIP